MLPRCTRLDDENQLLRREVAALTDEVRPSFIPETKWIVLGMCIVFYTPLRALIPNVCLTIHIMLYTVKLHICNVAVHFVSGIKRG